MFDSIYNVLWYFLIYSFGGWVVEVIYHAVAQGKIVNRGFLNGPVCPIYGIGVVAIFELTNMFEGSSVFEASAENLGQESSTLQLFIFGVVLATLVELIGGFVLDKLFHARWWDYSNKPLNLHGYICLEFSLIWGLAIVFVIRIVHPFISTHTGSMIPPKYGIWILGVLYIILLIDLIVTALTVSGLNKELTELDRISASMRKFSDGLTDFVGENSLAVTQAAQGAQVQAALGAAELKSAALQSADEAKKAAAESKARSKAAAEEAVSALSQVADEAKNSFEQRAKAADAAAKSLYDSKGVNYNDEMRKLREEYELHLSKLFGNRFTGSRRLLKAFPDLKPHEHKEAFADVKAKLKERVKKEE